MRRCRLEECALLFRRNIGNNDNQSSMQLFLGIEFCKVRSVVCHKCILPSLDLPHQLPVLLAVEPQEVHMFTAKSGLVRDFDE